VLATRHLSCDTIEEEFFASLRRVSSLAGGVMGQTGIESAELIRAVAKELRPAAVIAVWAPPYSSPTQAYPREAEFPTTA